MNDIINIKTQSSKKEEKIISVPALEVVKVPAIKLNRVNVDFDIDTTDAETKNR